MDGYHHIKITPLGFLKVLVSSKVEGEVKEVVGAVGWWSTLFERFEEWSPSWASNQRVTWLHCFGVPLHTWGTAIFRSIGYKFGKFIDTDRDTKNMLRGDVAKIQIVTESLKLIDSSFSVVVLGKNLLSVLLRMWGEWWRRWGVVVGVRRWMTGHVMVLVRGHWRWCRMESRRMEVIATGRREGKDCFDRSARRKEKERSKL
jgi:hypothetical protein